MTLSLNSSTDRSSDPKLLSPLTLAFLGDTVFDLFVREMVVCEANRPANLLHKLSADRVRASAQAEAVQTLMQRGVFTERELSVIRRGRNAHPRHKAKNMSEADYHWATGLEALFGYLYLAGETERLQTIFREICLAYGDDRGDGSGANHGETK